MDRRSVHSLVGCLDDIQELERKLARLKEGLVGDIDEVLKLSGRRTQSLNREMFWLMPRIEFEKRQLNKTVSTITPKLNDISEVVRELRQQYRRREELAKEDIV